MLLRLRVIFTVISAVFLAAVFPVGIFLDWPWAVACALCAGLIFVLMWVCKKKQEEKDPATDEPQPDFFTPKSEKTQDDEV